MKAWNYNTTYIIRIIVPCCKEQCSAPFAQCPVQSLLQSKQLQELQKLGQETNFSENLNTQYYFKQEC